MDKRIVPWIWVVSGLVGLTVLVKFFLKLPGVPYNVREIFYDDGSIIDLIQFTTVLIVFGAAPSYAGWRAANTRVPYFTIPFWCIVGGSLAFVLLRESVTTESMSDILGSPVLYREYPEIRPKSFVDFFERWGRFVALIGPLLLSIAVITTALIRGQQRCDMIVGLNAFFWNAIYVLPWLLLCKFVVINWAGTDNLTELITSPGRLGIGGQFFLFLIMFVVSLNAVLLAQVKAVDSRNIIFAALITIALTPVGWVLLQTGTVQYLDKYGTVFSAVEFLLGPDRSSHLSSTALYFRWTILQIGMVVVLTYGVKIFLVFHEAFRNSAYHRSKME